LSPPHLVSSDLPGWLVATVLLVVVLLAAGFAAGAMDLRGTREQDPPRRMPLLLASDPAWRSAGAAFVGALAHLGVAFVAANLAAVTVSVAGDSRAAAGAVFVPLAVGAWFAGRLLRRAGSGVLRSLWGFTAAIAAGYAGAAVGLIVSATGGSDAVSALIGALAALAVAVAAHLDQPATGTVAAIAVSAVVAPLAAVSIGSNAHRQSDAAVLAILATIGAVLALTDRLRPVEMTSFAAVAAGLGAAVTLVANEADALDQMFAFVLLVLVAVFALWRPAPGAVALLALAGAATLSLIAVAADVDAGPAVGPAVAGALGALLAAMEERTAVRDGGERPRLGGTYWVCAVLVLAAAPFLTSADAIVVDLLGFVCLLALLLAAAGGRRLIAVAIAIVELVSAVPERFAHGAAWGRYVVELGLVVAGVLIVVVATRTRRVGAGAAVVPPGQLPVAAAAVAGTYGEVFDAALSVLSAYGRLHHVDRDRGRLTSDEFSVAVWQLAGEPATNVAVWGPAEGSRALVAAVVERCARRPLSGSA
jgi:FtsH-binding integral membrane protein